MLFDFIKDAGDAIKDGIGGLTDGIKDKVTGSAKGVENVEVEEKGDTIILKGKAKTRAEAEKAIIAAGNTPGVSKIEAQIEIEEDGPEATFYTVQSGDTLSKIAKEHYGDAGKYPVIFEANRPMLSDPDKIYPGQMLRIPPQS